MHNFRDGLARFLKMEAISSDIHKHTNGIHEKN